MESTPDPRSSRAKRSDLLSLCTEDIVTVSQNDARSQSRLLRRYTPRNDRGELCLLLKTMNHGLKTLITKYKRPTTNIESHLPIPN